LSPYSSDSAARNFFTHSSQHGLTFVHFDVSTFRAVKLVVSVSKRRRLS